MTDYSIVLASQDINGEPGYQIHGIFPSFYAAALHVIKDADLGEQRAAKLLADWSMTPTRFTDGLETVQIGVGDVEQHWKASWIPFRNRDGV